MSAPRDEVHCLCCGRAYGLDRMNEARTFHCTCGARVGRARTERDCEERRPPRFMLDAMLGSLARWLRLLGYDAAYRADIPDADLVRQAVSEDRILLTRDRALPEEWRVSGIHLVEAQDTMAQLREIDRRFGLRQDARIFTRCSRCNEGLTEVSRAEARGHVPPHPFAEHELFLRCQRCQRHYWHGGHAQRIEQRLDEVLGASEAKS